MSVRGVPALVSSGWLMRCISAKKLAAPPMKHMRLLETSWEANGIESYKKQHIPTAWHYDMSTGVTLSQLQPKGIPNPVVFEDYVQSLGINSDTHVVVYDKGPMFNAARLWYTFKLYGHDMVSVVNGGMKHWLYCKLPVESGQPNQNFEEDGNFTVKEENRSMYTHFNDMVNNISENEFQIVDLRNPNYFNGSLPEPSRVTKGNICMLLEFVSQATIAAITTSGLDLPGTMQRGHIPHSINIENNHFVDPVTNCMPEEEDLKLLFARRGVDTHMPLVSMCYNGVSACLVPLAISHLQQQSHVAVYFGSWTEYGQKATTQEVSTQNTSQQEPISGA